MSSSDDTTLPESTYPALTVPEFRSQIPSHLLNGASAADHYILEQLSILTQSAEWSNRAHVSTMGSVRRTNGRLIRAEAEIKDLKADRKSVKVGWKVICAIAGIVVTVIGVATSLWQALKS